MGGLFVTATDTNMGKTLVSTALLEFFAKQGLRTAGFKPVAAGLGLDGMNEDVVALTRASSVELDHAQVGPVVLAAPCAPHIAAQNQGVELPLGGWRERAVALEAKADIVIAEGAGGFCVPLRLDPYWGLDDLAVKLGWPVLLVVGLRLGCINHTLLTVQAIKAKGLPLIGWVCNQIDPLMPWAKENLATLKSLMTAPCWGDIAWLTQPSTAQVVQAFDAHTIMRSMKVQP